jgi:uncharacterized protein
MLNPNVPAWFEIPTSDLDRAQAFYEAVLAMPLRREQVGEAELAVFPGGAQPNATGALIHVEDCEPSVQGSTVYLSLADIGPALERIAAQGGDVFVPRTELPGGMGWFAQFRDCEGNRVGLWSPA